MARRGGARPSERERDRVARFIIVAGFALFLLVPWTLVVVFGVAIVGSGRSAIFTAVAALAILALTRLIPGEPARDVAGKLWLAGCAGDAAFRCFESGRYLLGGLAAPIGALLLLSCYRREPTPRDQYDLD